MECLESIRSHDFPREADIGVGRAHPAGPFPPHPTPPHEEM